MRLAIQSFVRGLVGLNHVNARFDALEGRLGQMAYETSERHRGAEARLAEISVQLRAQADVPRTPAVGDTRSLSSDDVAAIADALAARLPSVDERTVERDKVLHQINYTNHK